MLKEAFLKGFLAGTKSLSKKTLKGYKQDSIANGGPDSFIAWLPTLAAKKIVGEKKVNDALWGIQRRAMGADMIAGHIPDKIMKKMPVGKELFQQKDMIPVGKGLHKEVSRTSLLAPAVKARDIAAPLIVGVALEKALKNLRKRDGQEPSQTSRE